ncbi:MAG TPA: hypothetical protein VN376_04225 [Longilinea sp.]|nr:hypothetical protein [Longilinea sp.]
METKFTASTHNGYRNWGWWIILIAAAVSLGGYLFSSFSTYSLGFPLDDAWIHQTYARSLANGLGWVYAQGEPTGGSTSPLWTVILSAGYRLDLPYLVWTFLVEWVLLAAIGIIADLILRKISSYSPYLPYFGIGLVFEWHLVWASGSGMEILLVAGVILALLFLPREKPLGWFITGLLLGVSIWIRPDMLTLAGPIGLLWLFQRADIRSKFNYAGSFLIGFVIIALPYFYWIHTLTGTYWPNTLYAKQTEYSILVNTSLVARFVAEIKQANLGAGLILLPGFLAGMLFSPKNKQWNILWAGIWWLGFALLYAVQLPVTYQYGRYMMPAMPIYFLIGMWGWMEIIKRLKEKPQKLLRFGFIILILPVLIGFYFIGARSYANDVAVIQTNMVEPSIWISENTQPDDLIAAHDIGAVGFFSQRDIVDLAGLVTPQVIPFIRDEEQLAEYLTECGVDYLMTFPDWYSTLGRGKPVVFEASGEYTFPSGQLPMTIYQWQ